MRGWTFSQLRRLGILALVLLTPNAGRLEPTEAAGATYQWVRTSSLSTGRAELAAVATESSVYALGGYNGVTLRTVDRLPVDSNGGLGLPVSAGQMVVPRYAFAAVRVGNWVLATGGVNQGVAERSTEIGRIQDDGTIDFTSSRRMVSPRINHVLAYVSPFVYAIAGSSGSTLLASVERARFENGELGEWEEIPSPLPTPRYAAGAVIGRSLYIVAGGTAGGTVLRSVLRGDVDDNGLISWHAESELNTQRRIHGVVAVGTSLLAVAGSNDGGGLISVERSHVTSAGLSAWTFEPAALTQQRHSHAVVAVAGRLYAIGGRLDPGAAPTLTNENTTAAVAGLPVTVTAISPNTARAGETVAVTVVGQNFSDAAALMIDGTEILSYTRRTDTEITASIKVAASAAAGSRDVIVVRTNDGERGVLAAGFRVERGVSNVVFIPGMFGSELSRLRQDGTEDRLWRPLSINVFDLCDLRLRTSQDDIYTNGLYLNGFVDAYDTWVAYLHRLKAEGTIGDYAVLPYDWRRLPREVAAGPIKRPANTSYDMVATIEQLSASSGTGRVSIIAHSLGGVVTAALMERLAAEQKTHLIDKIVFVGVPFSGAQQSLATALHGDNNVAYGLLTTDAVMREFAETSPSLYAVLPSRKLFPMDTPVIEFDDRPPVAPALAGFVAAYGRTITEYASGMSSGLRGFLTGSDSRTEPWPGECSLLTSGASTERPNVLKSDLLAAAEDFHDATFIIPGDVRVVNLVGVQRRTMSGLRYRTRRVCAGQVGSSQPCSLFLAHEYARTSAGDGTVVAASAAAPPALAETFYLDLATMNDVLGTNDAHGTLMRAWPVEEFIRQVITNEPEISVPFVTTPSANIGDSLEGDIHSPVTVEVLDGQGRRTSILKPPDLPFPVVDARIPNSAMELVDGHLNVTLDRLRSYTFQMVGTDYGVVGFDLRSYRGDQLLETVGFADIPVMPGSHITVAVAQDGLPTGMFVDADADGEPDVTVGSNGPTHAASLGILRAIVRSLQLGRGVEQSLLSKLEQAQAAVERKNYRAASGMLGAAIHEIETQSRPGKAIAPDIGVKLISILATLRDNLGT